MSINWILKHQKILSYVRLFCRAQDQRNQEAEQESINQLIIYLAVKKKKIPRTGNNLNKKNNCDSINDAPLKNIESIKFQISWMQTKEWHCNTKNGNLVERQSLPLFLSH